MSTEIVRPGGPDFPDSPQSWNTRRLQQIAATRFGERDLSFAELLRVVRARKTIIFTICGIVFVAAAIVTFVLTPRYESIATIQFNTENADGFGLNSQRGALDDANSTDYSVTQETQVKRLESDTLALEIVKELNLESRPEFYKRQSLLDYLRPRPDETGLPLDRAPYRRTNVLKAFHKNLRVEPVAGTRMINVHFLNPDRDMAATIANKLVADYREQSFEDRYQATMQSSDWLTKQLGDLKNQVESSQQKLVDYQKQVGILGTDETHNIVMTRLEDLNHQLMTAESNRILSQAVLQLVRDGNAELIPGLAEPSLSAGTSLSSAELTPLQNLRAQKQDLDKQFAQASITYGPSHPKVLEIENQQAVVNTAIDEEVKRLSKLASNDYVAAQITEEGLRASFNKEKDDANNLNDSAIQYTILKHEFESSRDLYDGLLQKLKEAGLLAGMRSTNMMIVDPARASDRPARPIIPLNLAIGLLGGLVLGVGGAFIAENIDDAVNSPDDAEEAAQCMTLGVVPLWKRAKPAKTKSMTPGGIKPRAVLVISQARSQPAEAFRAIRTSILQSIRPNVSTTILITSALPGEGKTTVSMNCAAAFAQQRAKVLLVEADLRRPTIASQLNLSTSRGLTSIMGGELCPELPIKLPGLPFLSVLPAGPQCPYPAELLGSERMQALIQEWHSEYDYIIFDTPPALSVTDPVVLASAADIVVMVAKSGSTTKQALSRAHGLFARTRPRVLGVVLNGFEPNSPYYSSYYGHDNQESNSEYYTPLPE